MGWRSPAAERGSRDLYDVLGVKGSASASRAELRAAFRDLAATYHPDRNSGDRRAAITFKRIHAAYVATLEPPIA